MPENNHWEQLAERILRAELSYRQISYTELSERLGAIGISETPRNLSNKIRRGRFSMAFALKVLHVIGISEARLRIEAPAEPDLWTSPETPINKRSPGKPG